MCVRIRAPYTSLQASWSVTMLLLLLLPLLKDCLHRRRGLL